MIPKVIHYCWFGGKPLPKEAVRCIDSWKKFFPDYKIKEWNESNFDVNLIPYSRQAYEEGKYAFVSDYARYKILYEEGGIYFDTDVEVIKSFDDILARGPFMGCETQAVEGNAPKLLNVNPGLGIGAPPAMDFYKRMIEFYSRRNFLNSDGSRDPETIVIFTSELLESLGLRNTPSIQEVDGIFIYPWQYFCPFNDLTGKLRLTPVSHSIHWYSKSWFNYGKTRIFLSRLSHRIFGVSSIRILRSLLRRK